MRTRAVGVATVAPDDARPGRRIPLASGDTGRVSTASSVAAAANPSLSSALCPVRLTAAPCSQNRHAGTQRARGVPACPRTAAGREGTPTGVAPDGPRRSPAATRRHNRSRLSHAPSRHRCRPFPPAAPPVPPHPVCVRRLPLPRGDQLPALTALPGRGGCCWLRRALVPARSLRLLATVVPRLVSSEKQEGNRESLAKAVHDLHRRDGGWSWVAKLPSGGDQTTRQALAGLSAAWGSRLSSEGGARPHVRPVRRVGGDASRSPRSATRAATAPCSGAPISRVPCVPERQCRATASHWLDHYAWRVARASLAETPRWVRAGGGRLVSVAASSTHRHRH